MIDRGFLSCQFYGRLRAYLHAFPAANTPVFHYERACLVLRPFTLGRCTTHRKIFYRAAKPGNLVSFEMAHHDHAVGCGNVTGNGHCIEMFLPDGHPGNIFPAQAICNDDRCTNHGVIKPVKDSSGDMIDGISPAPQIQRVGIRHKRQCSGTFDLFHNLAHKHRADVGIIPQFAKMQFHCRAVMVTYTGSKTCCIKEPLHLYDGALLIGTAAGLQNRQDFSYHQISADVLKCTGLSYAPIYCHTVRRGNLLFHRGSFHVLPDNSRTIGYNNKNFLRSSKNQ